MNGWGLQKWALMVALGLGTIWGVNRLAPPALRSAIKPNQ